MILDAISQVLGANNRKILAGISGGPDSLCLLDGLTRLDIQVAAAHYNHCLRPGADQEARQVQEIARRLGTPFFSGAGDVLAHADEKALSLEEAARNLRYAFLFKTAREWGADAVAVGHNANDQVETVLMNLIRGCGLEGLSGMPARWLPNPWSDEITLLRPLLGTWREDISAYCLERNISPIIDPSNQDMGFFRNRVRGELLPLLEEYAPGVKKRIWQTAEITAEDHASLEKVTDHVWKDIAPEQAENYIQFPRANFVDCSTGIQRRLLLRMVKILNPCFTEWSYQIVEQAREFVADPPPGKDSCLAGGINIRLMGNRVFLYRDEENLPTQYWPQLPGRRPLDLPVPGEVELSGGWLISARFLDRSQIMAGEELFEEDPYQAWLDIDQIDLPLQVRSRVRGDRFKPLGMGGQSMKLSDLMINQKIPRPVRALWPLVVSGEDILWVPGCRQSHRGRISSSTGNGIHLILTAPGDG